MKKILLFLSLFLLIIPIYGNAIVSPTNEFYINDYANILSSETEEYISENKDLKRSQNIVASISNLMNPLTYVIVNIAIVVILWVSGLQVNQGSLKQGEVIAIYNYMSQILIELIKLANLIITISKAIACGNRINDVLNLQSSLQLVENICYYNAKRMVES